MISVPAPSVRRASTSILPFKNGSMIAGISPKFISRPGPWIRSDRAIKPLKLALRFIFRFTSKFSRIEWQRIFLSSRAMIWADWNSIQKYITVIFARSNWNREVTKLEAWNWNINNANSRQLQGNFWSNFDCLDEIYISCYGERWTSSHMNWIWGNINWDSAKIIRRWSKAVFIWNLLTTLDVTNRLENFQLWNYNLKQWNSYLLPDGLSNR